MSAAWLFGKLPAHGDFVARGLPADQREALDDWLAGSMAAARADRGDGFDAAYDQAPPWRFARESGGRWEAGAMAPSMDGVGRRYPIVVAVTGLDDAKVEGAVEAVEALLYDALAEGWDADRLFAAAGGVTATSTSRWTSGDRWWTLGGEWFDEAVVAGARDPRLMQAVLTMREERRNEDA